MPGTRHRCPECDGTEHIETQPGIFETCECQKEKLFHRACRRIGIPRGLWDCGWEDFARSRRLHEDTIGRARVLPRIARETQEHRLGCLTGGPERPRLDLATMIARDALREGHRVAIYSLLNLVNLPFKEGGNDVIAQAMDAHLFWIRLEISAVGHKWNAMTLDNILTYRDERGYPLTLLTSRLPRAALQMQFPDNYTIADRAKCIEIRIQTSV